MSEHTTTKNDDAGDSSKRSLSGRCVCGKISFTVVDDFRLFYQCHCKQCQQQTGTAFASNLFTSPKNLEWQSGAELVANYAHVTRDFSNSFCTNCGSPLPYVSKSGESLIVPAGCLDDLPALKPRANIFASEQAKWLEDGLRAEKYEGFETN